MGPKIKACNIPIHHRSSTLTQPKNKQSHPPLGKIKSKEKLSTSLKNTF
jgi:hypothetical protein